MTTAFGETLPVDGGSEDTWGTLLLACWIASYAAYQVRDENANWADYELSRPNLVDYAEKITAKGSTSGTLTHDIEDSNHFSATLTGNVTSFTLSNPSPTGNVCVVLAYITQDGTGGRTITFGSAFKAIGTDTTFSLNTTAADSVIRLRFETINAGTKWYVSEEVLEA